MPLGIIATICQIFCCADGAASDSGGACFCSPLPPDSGFLRFGTLTVWLLVFFLTPIIEMYLLIEVGGYIGAWPTIGLVMITAVIGVALLRVQGLATLTRGLGRLDQGELPAEELVEGLLLAVAGALLLTPGFVTDAFGFILLTPSGRRMIARQVLRRVTIVDPGSIGGARGPGFGRPGGADGVRRGSGERVTVIEGEFKPVDDDENPSNRR